MTDLHKALTDLPNVDEMVRLREAERAAADREFTEVVIPAVMAQERAKAEVIAEARKRGQEARRAAGKLVRGQEKGKATGKAQGPQKQAKKGKGKR
jgi:hypothetical protein